MDELKLSSYAYLGDALYELFIREKIIHKAHKINILHKITTSLVCAQYQAKLLLSLQKELTEDELEITRRARNIPLTACKRDNQAIHRQATSFEALLGFLYLNNKQRYNEILAYINNFINFS